MNLIEQLIFESQDKDKITKKSSKKKVKESMYELTPEYDPRGSFYHKAMVEIADEGKTKKLYSYGTLVAEVSNGVPKLYGKHSQTTTRHQREFLKQEGFSDSEIKSLFKKGVTEKVSNKKVNESTKMYKVEIKDPNGRVSASNVVDEVNAIMLVADFPDSWKKSGWTISREEIKESKSRKKVKESYGDTEKEELWDFLIEYGVATDDEIRLVTNINGYSVETLNDILFARTGYRSMEQLRDSEGLDESKSHKKIKEGYFDDYDYDVDNGWTDEDIELHKSIDWEGRNWEEYPVEDDSFEGYAILYGYANSPVYEEVKFIKYIRSNPIYPPYYAPVDKRPFKRYTGYVGPMYDGHQHKTYKVHDRFESQEVYDILSM